MKHKIYLIFLLFVMFFEQHDFISGKPLVGHNIKAVKKGQYSFVVAIAQSSQERNKIEKIFCTGALISLEHVLVAEHCFDEVEKNTFCVIAGSNKLRKGTRYSTSWWISYDQWRKSKEQHIGYAINDIAVIKLIEAVVEKITIASLSRVQPSTILNTDIVLLGWGDTNNNEEPEKLQMVNVKLISRAECTAIATSIVNDTVEVPPQYLCTRANPYSLISYGDSGGPLLYEGEIIAISKGVIPDDSQQRHPDTLNVHLMVLVYTEYINDILLM